MIIHLLPVLSVTVIPGVGLLLLAIVFQPRQLFPARHHTGVRATRPAALLIARCEAERKPAPTGWQSPAWTVSREVTS